MRKLKLVLFWPIISKYAACPGLWLAYSISLHWSVWFSVSQCYHLQTASLVGVMLCARVLCGLPLCAACVCFPIVCKFIRVTVLFYVGKNFLRVIHPVWLLQAAVSSSRTPEAWEERKAIDIYSWVSAPESLTFPECCPVEGLCENLHL